MKETQELQSKRIIEAIDRLKDNEDFKIYLNEIKNLTKAITLELTRISPVNEVSIQRILFLQSQLDILYSVYSINNTEVINEVNAEQYS